MSLLNDMLRDLQTRGAFGLEPLSGLEPVAEAPMPRLNNSLMLPLLAIFVVVSGMLLWPAMIDVRWPALYSHIPVEAVAPPQTDPQDFRETSLQPEPEFADERDRSHDVIDRSAQSGTALLDDEIVPAATDIPPVAAVSPVAAAALVTDATPAADVLPAETSPVTTNIVRRDTQATATDSIARGLQAMRARNLPAAERNFRDALAIDSGDSAVWSYLYSVQLSAAKLAAAEQTLRQGLIAAQAPAPLAKLYARLLLERGEKHTAVSVLRDYRPAAQDAEYEAFLAALLQQNGRYAESRDIYRRLLVGDPDSGSSWIGLAMSEDSLGNRASALSSFQRALRADYLKVPLTRYAQRRITELQTNE